MRDTKHLVHAKAAYYPTFVRVFVAKHPYLHVDEGYERPVSVPKSADQGEKETNLERSLRRTRRKVKDYVLCNEFELFVTFTTKADRQNIVRSKQKLTNWLHNQRNRTGKFEYIIVPEFHKDGQSLHFHALFKGYAGEVKQSYHKATGKLLRGKYRLPSYTLGYTDVKKIDTQDTRTKVAWYIQKYITKDMPLFNAQKRYWVSRGLKLPKTEDNPEKWYEVAPADRIYEVDFGTVLEFDTGKHVLVDMFWEAHK